MFRHIKYLIISIISLAFILSFSSCSGKAVKIEWVLIGGVPVYENMQLGLLKQNGKVYQENLIVNETKTIRINPKDKMFWLDNDSSICAKIQQEKDSDVMEIYLYPCRNFIENEDSYVVEPADDDVYYYIELFDDVIGKNYMLISKDNVIDKKGVLNKLDGNLDDLLDSIDSDFAYYPVGNPSVALNYNGYIIKSKNYGNYVFLSTQWGEMSYMPTYMP